MRAIVPCFLLLIGVSRADETADRLAWLKANAVPMKSIDPSDGDFKDLEPLRRLIGDSRVVLLGEQTHGDGATFHAKTRLIRFLHQKMGFDVIAFESGMYDCRKANDLLTAGTPARQAVPQGVFGIWCRSKECQPLIDYIGKTAKEAKPLELCGFDSQLTASASHKHLVKDLTKLIRKLDRKLFTAEQEDDFISAVESLMEEKDPPLEVRRERQRKALAAFVTAVDSLKPDKDHPAAELAWWKQVARSLAGQAECFWVSDKKGKEGINARDAQMAKNLVWLARDAYPKRRIIVWAASFHNMRNQQGVKPLEGGDDYKDTHPMGDAVWKALGKETYSLGFVAAEGQAGLPWGQPWDLKPVRPGSFEELCVKAGLDNAIVDFRSIPDDKHWLRDEFEARPLGHSYMKAKWAQVFDGFVFTKKMTPSTPLE